MAGLTENGLEILNADTVLKNIVAAEKTNIDENIDTRPDELLGQLNNIIALALADQWELSQAVNDNFNPLKAEGKNLDDIGSITGITRNNSTPSTSLQQIFSTATVPTIIEVGTFITSDANLTFVTTAEVSVQSTNTFNTKLTINAVAPAGAYSMDVNGDVIGITSTGVIATDIVTWLIAINAAGGLNYEATGDETTITVTSLTASVTVTALTGASVLNFGIAAPAEATVNGTTISAIGTVNKLLTAVTGMTTTNAIEYNGGSFVETDEKYRIRILNNQGTTNAATEPAITAAVQDIDGVSSVVMIQNRTDTPSGGLPAHSFETIVEGGDSQTIAQKIWDFQPAGIEAFGDIPFTVKDSNDADQSVSFTRPTAINIAIRVTYAVYAEETQTSNVETVITEAVLTHINGLASGVDMISARLFGPITAVISGYYLSVVEMQTLTNPGDAPNGGSWSTANIAIPANQFAAITTPDVTYVVV